MLNSSLHLMEICLSKSQRLLFKNAELISSPNGDLSFKITTSFGSVSAQEYQCHYMGDQKIIEWNRLQNKLMLSFTPCEIG
jgi:hypothetical protein